MKLRKRPLRRVYWLVVDRCGSSLTYSLPTHEDALAEAKEDAAFFNRPMSVVRVVLDEERGEEVVKA